MSYTSRRTVIAARPVPRLSMGTVVFYGLGAGLAGVAMMTFAEKIEQLFTNRPNSLVPGRTLERLLGWTPLPESQMFGRNMMMHYGQGVLGAVIRAYMSWCGVRGPFADFMFTGIRLLID